MVKKAAIVVGACFLILIAILIVRALRFSPLPCEVEAAVESAVDRAHISNRLAEALRFKTVSYQDANEFDGEPFLAFHRYIQNAYPNVHANLQKEIINEYSLLYTWKGRTEDLKPILLLAHQDVVPVPEETKRDWSHPPFAGQIAEGHIWGRGALDMKFSLIGILEAVEMLLEDGFQPRRTVLLAFGHDEEIGGINGAARIAQTLRSRHIRCACIVDEGGVVTQNVVPGVKRPVALIGTSEKGYASFELKVEAPGGHSSKPPRHTAIGILCRAITKLEDVPCPSNMAFSSQFFRHVGPYMPFSRKIIFANLWLFRPVVAHMLSKTPEMNAGIRTTTATTMFDSGDKENVLPTQATAVVNARIMHGENAESVMHWIKRRVNDARVRIEALPTQSAPSPVSDVDSAAYKTVKMTIQQVFARQEVVVAPFLMIGATDSRHYTGVSEHTYRFFPAVLHREDLNRIHGVNERISIENYTQTVNFYYQLIHNFQKL
jgi:carboxypeptidase PM20D1